MAAGLATTFLVGDPMQHARALHKRRLGVQIRPQGGPDSGTASEFKRRKCALLIRWSFQESKITVSQPADKGNYTTTDNYTTTYRWYHFISYFHAS